jgi:hypothetical protein
MCSTDILRDLARAKAAFQLRAIETIIRGSASADTHRMAETETGSGRSLSGAVANGETPNPGSATQSGEG